MKKDLNSKDEHSCSTNKLLKTSAPEKRMARVRWAESSEAIARDGDDYLVLGEFPNLEDKDLEW
jgi:antitoxin MazE